MAPRVLVLADDCNPEWPSLPVVGYKYARSLAKVADVTLATHVRNQENIEKQGDFGGRIIYINNEWLAAPMYRLARVLRRGPEVAWSVQQIMNYLPYIEFERRALAACRKELDAGQFDIVHRITPMSPTLPSYIAGRTSQPFVIGPLNGNLPWPAAFRKEQAREKERLRILRNIYHYLPFTRRTYRKAQVVLAAFRHTIDDLTYADPKTIVPVPEIGFDSDVFHAKGRSAPFSGPGPYRFLYAGRLVPYKVPEAAIRAFATSQALAPHKLSVVGDGPEMERLQAIVRDAGAQDRISFEGRKTQAEVAAAMRASDAFIFPSIRELGAGVVIEAMASGMVTLVSDYGAPGDLVANQRGIAVPLAPLDALSDGFRAAMEGCLENPQAHAELAQNGQSYAARLYEWDTKAAYTAQIYKAVLAGESLESFTDYV